MKKKEAVCKDFNTPDERRDFWGHGHLDVVSFDENLVIGKGVFEPGWRWSNDVKPIAETESCEAEHFGYCLSGAMVIRMDDGKEIHIKAGQGFYLPPGHDAWVVGNEPCVLLDFGGYREYALSKDQQAKKAG